MLPSSLLAAPVVGMRPAHPTNEISRGAFQHDFFPERVMERPICPTCGALMRLVWIAANKQDDPDRHTFECPACTTDFGQKIPS